MRPLVLVGIILIVIGVAGLLYGGFTYTEDRDVVDLGVAEVEVTDKERVNIHPAVGGVVLAAGIVVLAMSGRKPAAT